MTRALISSMLALLMSAPAVADEALRLLPGEITTRFEQGVTDLELDADWEWRALVCDKACRLQTVKLKMTPTNVPTYDGEPAPGHVYALDRALDVAPLVLLRGLPGEAQDQPASYLHAGMETYPASSTAGTLEFDIPLPGGKTARLVPRYLGKVDGDPRMRWYLESDATRQVLLETTLGGIDGAIGTARGKELLRWAGDLDGDGKLDLLLNFSSRSDVEAAATLYLSSGAGPGDLVRKAGEFSYWPPDNPGC